MIRVHIEKKNGNICKVTLNGHADYRDYGQDIVCAAVSATYLCTVRSILKIDEDAIKVLTDKDIQIVEVSSSESTIQKILLNMVECLEELEKQYPHNLKLDKEEK